MNTTYRLLQLVNSSIGAVAAGSAIPLGVQNRAVEQVPACQNTFNVTTTSNNVVYINEPGYYKIIYTGYLTVGAAGDIIVNLQVAGQTVQTATVTVPAAGTYLVTFTYVTKAINIQNVGNVPLAINLQLGLTGVNLTGGSSVTIIERSYSN